MTNSQLEALVRPIESLRACLIVEAASGAVHREFTRGPMPVEPEAVARAVAGLARAQTDIVGLADPAEVCTLEWPSVTVIVRSASASALVVFFFNAETKLGIARMLASEVLSGLGSMIPAMRAPTQRAMPAVSPGRYADLDPAPTPPPEPPAPDPKPASGPSRGQRLLDYLGEHAPDTHAALLRVSLQTGLPLSLLKSPEKLSGDEFDQVTASVRRILGVEQLPL